MQMPGQDAPEPSQTAIVPQLNWTPEDVVALREFLRCTQAELALKLGTRQQTISEWELGRHRPRGMSKQLLDQLAREVRFYGAVVPSGHGGIGW
jgi:DNA-binding transcriptional regulator YiaG